MSSNRTATWSANLQSTFRNNPFDSHDALNNGLGMNGQMPSHQDIDDNNSHHPTHTGLDLMLLVRAAKRVSQSRELHKLSKSQKKSLSDCLQTVLRRIQQEEGYEEEKEEVCEERCENKAKAVEKEAEEKEKQKVCDERHENKAKTVEKEAKEVERKGEGQKGPRSMDDWKTVNELKKNQNSNDDTKEQKEKVEEKVEKKQSLRERIEMKMWMISRKNQVPQRKRTQLYDPPHGEYDYSDSYKEPSIDGDYDLRSYWDYDDEDGQDEEDHEDLLYDDYSSD
eukprot:GILI01022406.1.p1 GENE.GILI01022406.1~~GILI01022406.1.p1  ORF type:complete len:281 (-),score=48.70 GILI01022406.1:94-936(-)